MNKKLIIGGIILVIGAVFFIPAKWNEFQISAAIGNKDYNYFCVIETAKMYNKKSPGLVRINNNIIDTGTLWGEKTGVDGTYAVIFSDDMATATKIFTAKRKQASALANKKIPYCTAIQ